MGAGAVAFRTKGKSMNIKRVVLTGGAGFIGSAVANQLSEAGISVVIPVRRRSRAAHLFLLPTAEVVEADIHDSATLQHLLSGADAVVNLVGVLHSRAGDPYGPAFAQAHVALPEKLVQACRSTGVKRLIHVSALGADTNGPSEYQRSKAAGEAKIQAAGTDVAWTLLRPSAVFGPGDRFTNLFAELNAMLPFIPLAHADSRLQPVYVEDVARVVLRCLRDADSIGQTFELAGPAAYTLRQFATYIGELTGKRRPIVALPEGLAMLQARLMELLPNPPLSRDNLRSLRRDNVATAAPLPFGMTPTALESIVPGYLGNRSVRAYYFPMRRRARRNAG